MNFVKHEEDPLSINEIKSEGHVPVGYKYGILFCTFTKLMIDMLLFYINWFQFIY